MPEHIQRPVAGDANPSVRHERSDASFGWVLGIIVVAAILGVIIHYGVMAFLNHSAATMARERRSPFPLAPAPPNTLPPEPRLEQFDRLSTDVIAKSLTRETTSLVILESLGPTRETGFVHIPIDRAMRLLAGKLPARKAEQNLRRRDSGLVNGGASNSGRLFKTRGQR